MRKKEFDKSVKVEKENLKPIDSLEKCEWVAELTSKASELAFRMKQKDGETKNYQSYYYSVNHLLEEARYNLKTEEFNQEEFKKECERVYQDYHVDFDFLQQNAEELRQSHQINKQIERYKDENYYKFEYDEEGKRVLTDIEKEGNVKDRNLSAKLERHVEQVQKRMKQDQNKQMPEKEGMDKE